MNPSPIAELRCTVYGNIWYFGLFRTQITFLKSITLLFIQRGLGTYHIEMLRILGLSNTSNHFPGNKIKQIVYSKNITADIYTAHG